MDSSNEDILNGRKLFQQSARRTLPYLIRQAKAGETIYYSELGKEVDVKNPRNFNHILGFIGNALIELGNRTGEKIPPIQCLVINKTTKLPGNGIGWFISEEDFREYDEIEKRRIVDYQLGQIYTYPHWDWVLQELDIEPVVTNLDKELERAKQIQGGGESEAHKQFKRFIATNPRVLGLKCNQGEEEYILQSADRIDVLFRNKKLIIGVEVKSSISNDDDILRGLFQCIKYKHLIEAEQIVNDQNPKSRVILALQGKFPEKLNLVKNLLGIEVIDNIHSANSIL